MSKPETPCHPDCYVGAGGSILHAPGCTKNATKAEAPPAPKWCGVCGSVLVRHRVYMRPDSWVCVKSGCLAWRWDGEPVPSAPKSVDKNHAFQVDRVFYPVERNEMTGWELMGLLDHPADRELWQSGVGAPDRKISPDDVVEVRAGCRFYSAPKYINNSNHSEQPLNMVQPVSEPPNWDELVRSIAEDPDDFAPAMAKPLDRAYLALKAQLDTDREVLKETENNISNLAKFAASPITPNYNLPMSGLAIAIRDSLAAALGREILLTQEWDALKAQNVELAHEIALAAENWAEREESFNVLDGQVDRLTAQNADLKAELERLRDLIVGKSDGDSARDEDGCFRRRQRGVAKFEADHEAFEAEADSIRAAREAAEIDERELRQLGGIEALVDKSRRRREERAK